MLYFEEMMITSSASEYYRTLTVPDKVAIITPLPILQSMKGGKSPEKMVLQIYSWGQPYIIMLFLLLFLVERPSICLQYSAAFLMVFLLKDVAIFYESYDQILIWEVV